MKIKLIIPAILIGCLISCVAEKQERQGYKVSVIVGDNIELRDSLRSKRQNFFKKIEHRHKGRFLGQIFRSSKVTIQVDSITSTAKKPKQ